MVQVNIAPRLAVFVLNEVYLADRNCVVLRFKYSLTIWQAVFVSVWNPF